MKPKAILLRAVPQLDPVLMTDDIAAFILDRSPNPTLLKEGEHKLVLDLGDGTVARIYRTFHLPSEDPDRDFRPITPFELEPLEVQVFGRTRVEIQPKLGRIHESDFHHLLATLHEHGMHWEDRKAVNAGVSQDELQSLKLFDGGLHSLRLLPDIPRFYGVYTSKKSFAERYSARDPRPEYLIAVIGNDEMGRLFFKSSPDGSELTWTCDQSLITAFEESPRRTMVWLTRFSPRGLTIPSAEALQQLACDTQAHKFSTEMHLRLPTATPRQPAQARPGVGS